VRAVGKEIKPSMANKLYCAFWPFKKFIWN